MGKGISWRVIVVAAILASLFVAGTVQAQAARKEAMSLAQAAGEAAKAGRFDEAIAFLEQAYQRDPAPVLLYNFARVYEKKGDKEKAKVYYERYIASEKEDQEGIRQAQLNLAAIIATMSGKLMVLSEQTNALVLINDKTSALIPMDKPIELPPGEYDIGLKLCGFSVQHQKVVIKGGELTTVRFVLTAAPGSLVIDCSKASTSVKVDGESIGDCPIKKEMPVEAGRHQIEFLVVGRAPKVLAFEVKPYQLKTIKFK